MFFSRVLELFVAASLAFANVFKADILHFDVLAQQGHSCRDACISYQATCEQDDYLSFNETEIRTSFEALSVKCQFDGRTWWSFDQPSIVIDPFDSNFGRCLGWRGKPQYHDCSARHPGTRRICRCRKSLACTFGVRSF